MPESSIVKYLAKLKFEIDGVVEKADIIGAIFGQTEGLFGPEMNLNELQKAWKLGRIEINLESKKDKTHGEVLIPMSTDIQTAALIAAAVENVDKVGPCSARFTLGNIEDVRAAKRRVIVERAKAIVRDWASKSMSEGEEVLKDVIESVKPSRVSSYGPEALPAGPILQSSDTIILVEGRADVINLLRAGFENVIGIEGTSIPETVIKLTKGKKRVIAFLDGDRGGDLILKELMQVAKVDQVFRAPPNREVEDLTPMEIIDILGKGPPLPQPPKQITSPLSDQLLSKVQQLYPQLNGTLEAIVLDGAYEQLLRAPVSELVQKLDGAKGAKFIVFDGIITQRLLDAAAKIGVNAVIGHRTGELAGRQQQVTLTTFGDLGLE